MPTVIKHICNHCGHMTGVEAYTQADIDQAVRQEAILFCAERTYKLANPETKMDVPSMVYEKTEKAYDKWRINDRRENRQREAGPNS